MDVQKRKLILSELGSQGYSVRESWAVVNGDNPKTSVWMHKPSYTQSGELNQRVGTLVSNQPCSGDYMMMLSRLGKLPWQPSPTCKCKACRERDWAVTEEMDEDGNTLPSYVKLGGAGQSTAPMAVTWPEFDGFPEMQRAHKHQYGKRIGSSCRFAACDAVRTTAYRPQKKKSAKRLAAAIA